jgi:hypothetical protein
MARLQPGGPDEGLFRVETTFTGAGSSAAVQAHGPAWVYAAGTWSGAIQVEGSLDGGTTWVPVFANTSCDPLLIITNGMMAIPSPEQNTLLRLTALAGFTGTATARISGGFRPGTAPR